MNEEVSVDDDGRITFHSLDVPPFKYMVCTRCNGCKRKGPKLSILKHQDQKCRHDWKQVSKREYLNREVAAPLQADFQQTMNNKEEMSYD